MTTAQTDSSGKPAVILVNPQLGENIGTAARAMANFALCELHIVEPRDGWPNERALSASAGAVLQAGAGTIQPGLRHYSTPTRHDHAGHDT